MSSVLNEWRPTALSLVRMVSAFLFMQHGGQKILGFPAPARSEFELFSLLGAAGVLELAGGALLLVGLYTRPVAFLLSGQMAVAYFMVHHPRGFWPLNNGGELAIMFCFVFFYLVFSGGGNISLDRLRGRR